MEAFVPNPAPKPWEGERPSEPRALWLESRRTAPDPAVLDLTNDRQRQIIAIAALVTRLKCVVVTREDCAIWEVREVSRDRSRGSVGQNYEHCSHRNSIVPEFREEKLSTVIDGDAAGNEAIRGQIIAVQLKLVHGIGVEGDFSPDRQHGNVSDIVAGRDHCSWTSSSTGNNCAAEFAGSADSPC